MKVNIEIEMHDCEVVTPFDQLKDALASLLAFKTLNKIHGYTLPDVSIKVGSTSLTMKGTEAFEQELDEKAPSRLKLA